MQKKRLSHTESLVQNVRSMPPLSEAPTQSNGPIFQRLTRRTLLLYLSACLVGILPSVLSDLGILSLPCGIRNMFLGLIIPGGSFIATGNILHMLIGLGICFFYFHFGLDLNRRYGNIAVLLLIWLVGMLGGFCEGGHCLPYAPWVLLSFAALVWGQQGNYGRQHRKACMERRVSREAYFDEAKERLSAATAGEPTPPAQRELSLSTLNDLRYLFSLTLRDVGDLSGYDRISQYGDASYRYQLDYIGYTLLLMQCHYTPNFHGYLNRATRFTVESLTLPDVCGYWKNEYLGGALRWNPDPIGNSNIMFSGWSGLLPIAYAGNTGDRRYEEPGALKFNPHPKGGKTYDYNSKGIVEAITRQWDRYPTVLFPCEPHMTFPICNAYGMIAVLAYDRDHGTDYAKKIYPRFVEALEKDFVEPDGGITIVRNTLTGLRMMSVFIGDAYRTHNTTTTQVFSPVHYGLGLRNYLFLREEVLRMQDGEISSYIPWADTLDIGNLKKGPGYALGLALLASTEYGDTETTKALWENVDRYLKRSNTPGDKPYPAASVIGNVNIISSHLREKNDWFNLIHHGPDPAAFTGPLLTVESFPEVLVARAVSNDGKDLEMVLYNGKEPGSQHLTLGRLVPNAAYQVAGGERFTAGAEGTAEIPVWLDGRTLVHVLPA